MPTLTLRLRDKEFAQITAQAQALGMPTSTYVKSIVTQSMARPSGPEALLAEIERTPSLLARLRHIVLSIPKPSP